MPTHLHRHAGDGACGHPPLARVVLLLTVAALLALLVFGARTAAGAEARDPLVPSGDVVVGPRDAIGGAVASGHDHPRPASIAVVAGRVRHADPPAAVAR